MTALVGTVLVSPRWDAGQQYTSVGTYALAGALVAADTITWDNLIPKGAQVLDVSWVSPELDTNASPTATISVGDGTDADGFMLAFSVGIAAASLTYVATGGNGATIGSTYSSATDVVATVASAVATGATSGTIFVKVTYNCVGVV